MLRRSLGLSLCAIAALAAPSHANANSAGIAPGAVERPISVDLTDAPLPDVLTFFTQFTGIRLEPMWLSDTKSTGLDPELEISLSVTQMPAIAFLERICEAASTDFEEVTWQHSRDGYSLEIGPLSRLNERAYRKVYDLTDMLQELPDFDDAPRLDLDQVLNQGGQGGGGSGGSIFEDNNDGDFAFKTPAERADEIVSIVQAAIRPEQWRAAGGDGAWINETQGALLIHAPNYIHRELDSRAFPF